MTVEYRQVFFGDEPLTVDAAAQILVVAFHDRSLAWPTVSAAYGTMNEFAQDQHIAFGAFADSSLVGWIGATPSYNGNVWEIQLLGVIPEWQRNGVATALVRMLISALVHVGCHTVCVWCDDESKSTRKTRVGSAARRWLLRARRVCSLRHPARCQWAW